MYYVKAVKDGDIMRYLSVRGYVTLLDAPTYFSEFVGLVSKFFRYILKPSANRDFITMELFGPVSWSFHITSLTTDD